MRYIIGLGKAVTLTFWGAYLLNFNQIFPETLNAVLLLGGPLILIAHTIQALFFIRKFKDQLPELSAHALSVLVFGFFHFLEVSTKDKVRP